MEILTSSYIAGGTIDKYHLVTASGEAINTVTQMDGANEIAYGVAMDDAVSGEEVRVCHLGIVPIVGGAAIAKGVRVMGNSSGHAVTLAQSGYSIGVALEAADASGDYTEILLLLTNYLMA